MFASSYNATRTTYKANVPFHNPDTQAQNTSTALGKLSALPLSVALSGKEPLLVIITSKGRWEMGVVNLCVLAVRRHAAPSEPQQPRQWKACSFLCALF